MSDRFWPVHSDQEPWFRLGRIEMTTTNLVVGATVLLVDVIVMWGFFAVAAQGLRRLTASARGQRIVNRLFGSLFIGVGVLLAVVH